MSLTTPIIALGFFVCLSSLPPSSANCVVSHLMIIDHLTHFTPTLVYYSRLTFSALISQFNSFKHRVSSTHLLDLRDRTNLTYSYLSCFNCSQEGLDFSVSTHLSISWDVNLNVRPSLTPRGYPFVFRCCAPVIFIFSHCECTQFPILHSFKLTALVFQWVS